MKHLFQYDGYSTKERLDDILDKISKYGISSISDLEKQFLDAHAIGNEEEFHKIIIEKESETIFEDDDGYFKFEFKEKRTNKGKTYYIGVIYVPDINKNGKIIEGRLEGKIIKSKNENILKFKKKDGKINLDISEFCDGLEYELDRFIDYIIQELK